MFSKKWAIEVITDSKYDWNNIERADVSVKEVVSSLDISSAEGVVNTYVNVVDSINYGVMSQTEITSFVYRFSVWGMGKLGNFAGLF